LPLTENYDLTKNEYTNINDLRKECLLQFLESNQNHEKLLKDLVATYIEITNISIPDFSWKTLGFQVRKF